MNIKFKDLVKLFPSSQMLYLVRADENGLHELLENRADSIRSNKHLMFNIGDCTIEEITAEESEVQCITIRGGKEDF